MKGLVRGLVSVLSAPRGESGQETNANYERIECGFRLAVAGYQWLLITGHPEEDGPLRREFASVRRAEGGEIRDIFIDDQAYHTPANAYVTLEKARELFGARDGVITVVTSDWHLPRTKKIFKGLRDVLVATRDPRWQTIAAYKFKFVGVHPKTGLDFAASCARKERGKMREVDDLLLWYGGMTADRLREEILRRPDSFQLSVDTEIRLMYAIA